MITIHALIILQPVNTVRSTVTYIPDHSFHGSAVGAGSRHGCFVLFGGELWEYEKS